MLLRLPASSGYCLFCMLFSRGVGSAWTQCGCMHVHVRKEKSFAFKHVIFNVLQHSYVDMHGSSAPFIIPQNADRQREINIWR
jgi:hypothetical protein